MVFSAKSKPIVNTRMDSLGGFITLFGRHPLATAVCYTGRLCKKQDGTWAKVGA